MDLRRRLRKKINNMANILENGLSKEGGQCIGVSKIRGRKIKEVWMSDSFSCVEIKNDWQNRTIFTFDI